MDKTFITLTDAAIAHIKKSIDKNSKSLGFRLSVKKTGCSGYAYVPKIIETVCPTDIHFIASDDANTCITVYIDEQCKEFVKDLIIDYVVDDQMGLKQKRLVFINPNEKNRCGCGESFTVE